MYYMEPRVVDHSSYILSFQSDHHPTNIVYGFLHKGATIPSLMFCERPMPKLPLVND